MKLQVPAELLWVAESPLVRMVEIEEADCLLPFWSQTLSRSHRTTRLLPLERIEGNGAILSQVKGFIYHMNRCGSTLVANALKSTERCRVLSEPFVFQQLLDNERGTPKQRQCWLRKLMALHLEALCGQDQALIIKWPSLLALNAGQIESAFPATPTVFLYRDPVEVLVSIQRQSLGNTEFTRAEHLGLQRDISFNFPVSAGDLRINALCIAHICLRIVEADNLIAVDYAALPSAFYELVAPHFRLPLTKADRNSIDKVLRIYSKDTRAKTTYLPDSEAKQRDATPEIRALATEIIQPALSRTLSLLDKRHLAVLSL